MTVCDHGPWTPKRVATLSDVDADNLQEPGHHLPAAPGPGGDNFTDPPMGVRRVWCLVGPTATGKTALSIAMANEAPIEVVSADSRMIYRWMDIGTAKPSATERSKVSHHLIDCADPDEPFTVVDWVARAGDAIERIWARGRQPLVVGGTGLYFRALCDGLEIPPVPPDEDLRSVLEERATREGWQALQADLRSIDPVSASRIEGRNVRRVIRAIEVTRATGRPFSAWQQRSTPPFEVSWAGLDLPRDVLDVTIDARASHQVEAGLRQEVHGLLDRGYSRTLPPMRGLAYREMVELIDGVTTPDEAVHRYQAVTRQYARRQQSWFRPDLRIRWFDPRTVDPREVVAHLADGQAQGDQG